MSLIISILSGCYNKDDSQDALDITNSEGDTRQTSKTTITKNTNQNPTSTPSTMFHNGQLSWNDVQTKLSPLDLIQIQKTSDLMFDTMKKDKRIFDVDTTDTRIADYQATESAQSALGPILNIQKSSFLGKIVFVDKFHKRPCVYEFAIDHVETTLNPTQIKLSSSAKFSNSVVCGTENHYAYTEGEDAYETGRMLFEEAFQVYTASGY